MLDYPTDWLAISATVFSAFLVSNANKVNTEVKSLLHRLESRRKEDLGWRQRKRDRTTMQRFPADSRPGTG